MKKVLFLLAIAFALTGCEENPVSTGRSLYKAYLKRFMKDPSSLVIYNESYIKNGYEIKWTIDYGGKNGFGGMTRETLEVKTLNGIIFTENGVYTLKDLK